MQPWPAERSDAALDDGPTVLDPPRMDRTLLGWLGVATSTGAVSHSATCGRTPAAATGSLSGWNASLAGCTEPDGDDMNGDDRFSEPGGRVERSTRLAGGLLLVSAVLTVHLTDLLFSRSPRVELFEGYDLAARVLAPAGAMLIAGSLAIRALTRPFSRPTPRAQLVVGISPCSPWAFSK